MSEQNLNLPVKSGDEFIGELETMDLSELKNKQFLVAVNQGDVAKPKFVCSTIRGPYTFEEMCEAVGLMWREHQHHGKVILCQKDASKPLKYLDGNTIDYIEAHYEDIITEAMLDGIFDEDKSYTCRAGVLESDNVDNPMAEKQDVEPTELPDELV